MTRYSVTIPAPSAKRMVGSCKMIVKLSSGWEGDVVKEYPVAENATTFEFDVPDEYEWIYSTSVSDGFSFTVSCQYSNPTGSRKETKHLVPQKL